MTDEEKIKFEVYIHGCVMDYSALNADAHETIRAMAFDILKYAFEDLWVQGKEQ